MKAKTINKPQIAVWYCCLCENVVVSHVGGVGRSNACRCGGEYELLCTVNDKKDLEMLGFMEQCNKCKHKFICTTTSARVWKGKKTTYKRRNDYYNYL